MASQNSLDALWKSFDEFIHSTSIPPAENTDQLPIDLTKSIRDNSKLKDFVSQLLKILKSVIEEEKCLFLDICIWDPFRENSPDNWALSGSSNAINKVNQELSRYLKTIKEKNVNVFYLFYTKLKKNILEITVNNDGSVSCEPAIESFLGGGRNGRESNLLQEIINLHSTFKKNKTVYIYYIPTFFYPEREIGIGGIILISFEKFNREILIQLKAIAQSSLAIVGVNYLFQRFFHHALRSAVAAIMARNMSHNIGSHVLNYLSNPEELDNLWVI